MNNHNMIGRLDVYMYQCDVIVYMLILLDVSRLVKSIDENRYHGQNNSKCVLKCFFFFYEREFGYNVR